MESKDDALSNMFGEYAEVNEQKEKSVSGRSIFDGIFAAASALETIQIESERIAHEKKKLQEREKELQKKEAALARRESKLQRQQAGQTTKAAEIAGLDISTPEQVRNAFIASEIFNRKY